MIGKGEPPIDKLPQPTRADKGGEGRNPDADDSGGGEAAEALEAYPGPVRSRVAEMVVLGALLCISQDFVSLRALFKLRLRVGILVPVRMVVEGSLSKCLSKLLFSSVSAYAEDFVIVTFGCCHNSLVRSA